jgi:hypothetical protein
MLRCALQLNIDELMAEEISENQYSVLGLPVFGIGEIGRDCETSMNLYGYP